MCYAKPNSIQEEQTEPIFNSLPQFVFETQVDPKFLKVCKATRAIPVSDDVKDCQNSKRSIPAVKGEDVKDEVDEEEY